MKLIIQLNCDVVRFLDDWMNLYPIVDSVVVIQYGIFAHFPSDHGKRINSDESLPFIVRTASCMSFLKNKPVPMQDGTCSIVCVGFDRSCSQKGR
jgi:hypothetical protein